MAPSDTGPTFVPAAVKAGMQDWIKTAVAGAIGFIVPATLTVIVSAFTGGSIIHLMGGLTKEDAFGGIYVRKVDRSGNGPGDFPNPLTRRLACDETRFDPVVIVALAEAFSDAPKLVAGEMILCAPKKSP